MNLYDWTYDFERDRDVFLTIGGGERPIPAHQLDEIALRMLDSADVPALLAPVVERLDGNVRLCYPVTGLKQLSTAMRSAPPDARGIYRLLARTAGILDRGKAYLLDEQLYILQSDLIFVSGQIEDMRFVYLPLKSTEKIPSLQEQFRQLLDEWMEHADQLPMKAWKELNRRLASDHFQLSAFRSWCMDQAANHMATWMSPMPDEKDEEDSAMIMAHHSENPELWKDQTFSGKETFRDSKVQTDTAFGKTSDDDVIQDLIPLEEAASVLLPKQRTPFWEQWMSQPAVLTAVILGMATVLAVCLFFPFPGSEIVMVAVLGMFILAVAAMLVWDRKKQKERMTLPDDEEADDPFGFFAAAAGQEPKEEYSPAAAKTASAARFGDADGSSRLSGNPFGQGNLVQEPTGPSQQTEWLVSPARTVLLSEPPDANAKPARPRPVLVVLSGGRELRQIPLQEKRLTIGREASAVDVVSDQAGVSRMHCELVKVEGGEQYALKDLGSRNGTALNDTNIVPFKLYPLKNGDRIRILQEEYEYREDM